MKKPLLILLLLFISTTIATATDLAKVRWRPLNGTVSLTFDDGPSPIFTPQILSILKKHNIKATFFVVGTSAKKYPHLLKQIVAEGHAVAIHTMTHPKLTRLSSIKLYKEVVGTKLIVKNILGKAPVCLRPPFGLTNKRINAYVRSHGMIPVPMGFNSFDYKRPGVAKLTRWVVRNAHPGMVILLHDGYLARQQTVKALPAIISGIRGKGIGFSSICN